MVRIERQGNKMIIVDTGSQAEMLRKEIAGYKGLNIGNNLGCW